MRKWCVFCFLFGLTVSLVDSFFDWTGEFTMGVMIGAGAMGLSMVYLVGKSAFARDAKARLESTE